MQVGRKRDMGKMEREMITRREAMNDALRGCGIVRSTMAKSKRHYVISQRRMSMQEMEAEDFQMTIHYDGQI